MQFNINILTLILSLTQSIILADSNHGIVHQNILENKEIQAQIKCVIHSKTDETFSKQLEQLKSLSGTNHFLIVPQLVLYSATATNMIDGMACQVILRQLNLPVREILNSILPYIGTTNTEVRKDLQNQLIGLDHSLWTNFNEVVNFELYKSIIKEKSEDPPLALIDYMYEREPKVALTVMAQVQGDKDLQSEVSTKVSNDSAGILKYFVDRPEWWAHLYAAEMMKKRPELREPSLIKKLQKDDHPLVKEKVAGITAEKLAPVGQSYKE